MHFITNGYKRFSKTNSTDPRQRVLLGASCQICRKCNANKVIIIAITFEKFFLIYILVR